MPTLASLTVKLIADVSDFEQSMTSAAERSRKFADGLTSTGKTMVAGLTLPLAAAGAGMLKLAIDAEETASKFDTVMGPAAGRVAEEIANMRDTIPATTAELQNAVADMTALGKAAGMTATDAADLSLSFVTAGADLASFNNSSPEEALAAIRSGLVGSSEPLLQFGVDVRQAALESIALENGLIQAGEAMDSTARAQAVLLAIQGDASDAMGDAARTAESTANQIKFLKKDVVELATEFGAMLIPAIQPVIDFAGRLIDRFKEMSPETQKVIVIVAAAAAAMGPLLVVLGSLVGAATTLAPVIAGLVAVVAGISAPVVIAVAAAAALGAALYLLWQNSETFRDIVIGAWEAVKAAAETVFNGIKATIETVVGAVTAAWNAWGDDLLAGATAAWDAIQAAVEVGLKFIETVIGTYVAAGKAIWDAFGADLVAAAQEVWGEIKLTVETLLGRAKEGVETILGGLRASWDRWGEDFKRAVELIWEDIRSKTAVVFGLVQTGIETVLGGIKIFWDTWGGEIKTIAETWWNQIQLVVETAMNLIKGAISIVLGLIRGDWTAVLSEIKGIAETGWKLIEGTVTNFKIALEAIWGGIKESVVGIARAMWEEIKGQFLGKIQEIKDEVGKFKDNITGAFQTMADVITFGSVWPDMWSSIHDQAKTGTADSVGVIATMGSDTIAEFEHLNEESEKIWASINAGIAEDVAAMELSVKTGTGTITGDIMALVNETLPDFATDWGEEWGGIGRVLGEKANEITGTLKTALTDKLEDFFGTKLGDWFKDWDGWLGDLLREFSSWAADLGGIIGTVGGWLEGLLGGGSGGGIADDVMNLVGKSPTAAGFGLSGAESAAMIGKSLVDALTGSAPSWAPSSGVSLGVSGAGAAATAAGAALPFAVAGGLSYGGEWLVNALGLTGGRMSFEETLAYDRARQAERARKEAMGFNFSIPSQQTDPAAYAAWQAEQNRMNSFSGGSAGGFGKPGVNVTVSPVLQIDGREIARVTGPYMVDAIRLQEGF